jgi:hypothetical protein
MQASPFSPERLAAIRSDPKATKIAQVTLGCKKCSATFKAYVGLDRSIKLDSEGWQWAPDIKVDEFVCECGSTKIDVSLIRGGLHAYIGHTAPSGQIDAVPLYERSVLQNIRNNFLALLQQEPAEEAIQRFIVDNPILLHQFAATKIIPKPQIGTKHRADFGILDSRGDLILIELEKSSIRLLKNDGHRTSDLVHAFEQVNDWLNTITDHRIAILEGLGLKHDMVHKIRGFVIAGRDEGHDAGHLRNLRKRPNDGHEFQTYDDLLGGLDTLIHGLEKI